MPREGCSAGATYPGTRLPRYTMDGSRTAVPENLNEYEYLIKSFECQ